MKCAGYARVSTTEQAIEGVSLDVQSERIRAYATMVGLDLVMTIREEGISGSTPLGERPGGRELLRLLNEDGVDHIVALKLDRLFRDAADALNQTRDWDRKNVALHLVDMGGQALNTASAMGRMFLTMTAAFAELERNLISERTATAMAHKKANGQHVGRPPFGFVMRNRVLVPVPEEQVILREVRQLRAEDKTLAEIAAWLTRRGVPTRQGGRWRPGQVRFLLMSRTRVA